MRSKTPLRPEITRDLARATELVPQREEVDRLLGLVVDTFGRLVPFDLATVMLLQDGELVVRIARGPLADERVRRHRLALERFPSVAAVMSECSARAFTVHDHGEGDGDPFDGVLDLPNGHCCMVVPLCGTGGPKGIMTFDRRECGGYAEGVVAVADVFGKLLGLALSFGEQSTLLARLKSALEEENRSLREGIEGPLDPRDVLEASASPRMRELVGHARQVAATDTPVLVSGETGTGKEVLARAIHRWSRRSAGPLISVNCAALPANLIESELFGHVKGAFSGATGARMGRFQAASGGTLFLDEVGELPLELQAKLLRVLQDGTFEPVGSDTTARVDVRVVAASNRDLRTEVETGRFRRDLYHRLAVFPLTLPPLRERREDIAIISRNFLAALARRSGRGPWTIDAAGLAWLSTRDWRGNVRELVNALERATILTGSGHLSFGGERDAEQPIEASGSLAQESARPEPLESAEKQHILRALAFTRGRIYGSGGAAEVLGIHPSTLRSRMGKLGLGGARDHRRDGGTR